ncbi:MAG: UDP-N-acetylmuramate dehydrogenase [Christensenellaceae bacterium]|nr:UDP-N-acetylmuramate dehydrogenase [Christensenellaceae bacterium]
MIRNIISALNDKGIDYTLSAPMSSYTSFRTGGNAAILISPKNTDEIAFCTSLFAENAFPYMVIGLGSNLLFSDKGYTGAVIRLAENFSAITISGDTLTAQAGARLSAVCQTGFKTGLYGMEFAGGIPGSVGGALMMNAGAYGGEIKDVLVSAEVLMPDGNVRTLSNEECAFGYRKSVFKNSGMTILSATFQLKKAETESELDEAKQHLMELNNRRKTSQPLEFPSAGSTFKRPTGYYAAALIDECGLKGFRIGGACVSMKHAGFVVNDLHASARDIFLLMQCVQSMVMEKKGVALEPEVILIGDFNA